MELTSTPTPPNDGRLLSSYDAILPQRKHVPDHTAPLIPSTAQIRPNHERLFPRNQPSQQRFGSNCDRMRPDEDGLPRRVDISLQPAGKIVTPFLRKHIPSLHARLKNESASQIMEQDKNPNTEYCYRHRPDAKYRRAADESKMVQIQHVRVGSDPP